MPIPLTLLLAAAPAPQFDNFEVLSLDIESATAVQVVDIDGDGLMDLVAGSRLSGEIFLWLRQGAQDPYPMARSIGFAPGTIRDIRTADLDRDGDQDLCVVTDGPAVSWLENLGGASFAVPVTVFAMNAVLPDAAARIRLVDMNGDGWTDILTCLDRGGVGAMSPVAICTNDGGGVFNVQVPITVAGSVSDVDAGDFDADGDLDIVVTGLSETFVYDNGGGGTFTLAGQVPAPAGSLLGGAVVSAHDQNTDGVVDLVVSYVSNLRSDHVFYRGYGDGTFAAPFILRSTTGTLLDVLFGDFDGNGTIDLLESLGSFGARVIVSPGFPGGGLDFGRPLPREGSDVLSMTVGDSDLDGVLELFSATESGTVTRRPEDPTSAGPDFAGQAEEITRTALDPLRTVAADFNGDGMHGFLTVSSESDRCLWWPTDGAGGFQSPRAIFEFNGGRELPQAVDLDGDGDTDIVRLLNGTHRPAWYENDGLGNFAARTQLTGFTTTFQDEDLDLFADLNGDGLLDWVRTSQTPSALQWQAGLGGGAFGAAQTLDPTGDIRSNTVAMDLDGDGSLDLLHRVGRIGINGPARWIGHLNNGTGQFAPAQHVGSITSAQRTFNESLLLTGDFDGDGVHDLLCRSNEPQGFGGILSVCYGLGTGFVGVEQVVETPATTTFEVQVGDFDGDGNDDFVVDGSLFPGSPNGILVYRSRGTRAFFPRQSVYEGFGLFATIATGDADGDGDDDIFLAGVRNDDVGVVRSLAKGNIGVPYCLGAVPNATGVGGEINASGCAQLSQASLRLTATSLPPQAFGIFITSQNTDLITATNSIGVLCLGGSIGRFIGPGQIVQAGAGGEFGIDADPAALPTPTGTTAALPGSTWHFQAWHRDTDAGVPTSNFTSAVSVMFL